MTDFDQQEFNEINCQLNIQNFFNNKDSYILIFNTIIEICLFPNHYTISKKRLKLFNELIVIIQNIVNFCKDVMRADILGIEDTYHSIYNMHMFISYFESAHYIKPDKKGGLIIEIKESIDYNSLIMKCLNYIFNSQNWDLNTKILEVLYSNESSVPYTMENSEEKKKFNLMNFIRVLHDVVLDQNENLFNTCLKNTIRQNMSQRTNQQDIMGTGTKDHKIIHIKNFCNSYKILTGKNIYEKPHRQQIIDIFLSGQSLSSTVDIQRQLQFKKQSVLSPVIFEDIGIIKPKTFNIELEPNFLLFLRELKTDSNITYDKLSVGTSGNAKDVGYIFEDKIKELLKNKFGFRLKNHTDPDRYTPGNFIQEPNGPQTYPDFHIVLNNHILEVEAKANRGSSIMFGSSIPKQTVLYLVLSPSADHGVTFMFGKNNNKTQGKTDLAICLISESRL